MTRIIGKIAQAEIWVAGMEQHDFKKLSVRLLHGISIEIGPDLICPHVAVGNVRFHMILRTECEIRHDSNALPRGFLLFAPWCAEFGFVSEKFQAGTQLAVAGEPGMESLPIDPIGVVTIASG